MRDDSANGLNGHPAVKHQHRLPKSSLKGSSSRLTLEAVAQAARRNAALKNIRLTAQTSLRDLLQGINDEQKVKDDVGKRLATTSCDSSNSSGNAAPETPSPPRAVVLCCTDCSLPFPESFGEAAGEVAVLRTRGNMVTPAVAASVGQVMEESGARLVVVMGHTQCAAVDTAIDAWLERHRSPGPWPWARPAGTQPAGLDSLPCGPSMPMPMPAPALPREPSTVNGSSSGGGGSSSSSSLGAKLKEEATRTDKIATMGVRKGGVLKSIFSCYCGADMSEDESHHGGGAYSGEDASVHNSGGGVASRSKSCSAADDCFDRTVVRTMGDTMQLAVDEVALERVKAADQDSRTDKSFRSFAADPDRLPIEAPRAQRSSSDLGSSRTALAAAAAAAQEQLIIGRDEETAGQVAAANAKLAAEALLRGLTRLVPPPVMRELEVVAMTCDVDSRRASVLQKGWYHNSCYYHDQLAA